MAPSSVSAHGIPGVVAAVLLTVGTIFVGRAAMGRRRVPGGSLDHSKPDLGNPSLNEEESSNLDHEGTDRSLEETEQSNSRADVRVPDIFLCHSGCQKLFVESLYKALQGANHTAFFDRPVLSKGRPYPDKIKEAARGCKVGVVVVSEEFFTSKWPMLELEMLISQRGPDPCVLPLFYQLKSEDLKSQQKLRKWRPLWKKMAGGEDGAKKWEQAVKALGRFYGEVYTQGTSTDAYIDRVVKYIGTLIPCHVPYDCSSIQGQSRLVKAIATKFDDMDRSRARMVGLHGVGGLGKTTLCKVMVNHYSRHYSGRSFLIEFPSHGADKAMITSECKKALRVLTDASEVHLLDKVDNFDQVVQLMRDRVGHQDVFLAIDNLWEGSLEEAKRVLQAGFSAKSKILVTSRSEGLLKDLLMDTYYSPASNASVAPLPAPEHEEAFQIFQESFGLRGLHGLVDMNDINNLLNRCRLNGSYHALALKALAKYVRRVYIGMDEDCLSGVLKEISAEKLEEVADVIRLSYDHLPEQKKHLFLDIVVFMRWCGVNIYAAIEEEMSSHWKLSKLKTNRLVKELSLDGLIQIEEANLVGQRIGLHDLYSELAWREIDISPRYLLQDGINIPVLEKVEWEKLETVIIRDDKSLLFEKLQQHKCPELKRLIVEKTTCLKGREVRLADSMPSLIVLEVSCISLVENEGGCAALDSENKNMVQPDMLQPLEQVTGMPSLEHKGFGKSPDQEGPVKSPRSGFVKGEGLVDASSVLHLNGLAELRMLKVKNYGSVRIAGLSSLVQLQVLHIESCWKLQKLLNLSSLTCLERLHLTDVRATEVGSLSCTLKHVSVRGCRDLKRMPDMSSLTRLERLDLSDNAALEEVGGLSCTLKDVSVRGCRDLKRMPDMSSLTCLERLQLNDNAALEEVGGLSCTLKEVSVRGCRDLKRMPDLSSLTCLERLQLNDNAALEEVGGECLSSTVKHLGIWNCGMLRSYPSVDERMLLETLEMGWADCLRVLQKVPNLKICLRRCYIRYDSRVKVIDVGCFNNLKYLEMSRCEALEEVIALRSLEVLVIKECPRLKKVSVGGPRLKRLRVQFCKALEEIRADLETLPSFEELCLRGCDNLKELGAVSSIRLQFLTLENCPSLQESSIPEAEFRD